MTPEAPLTPSDAPDQDFFVLELLSHKKLTNVSLVMSKLANEISENGYEFVDSENGFLYNSSRKAWMSWLVNAITFWSCKIEEVDTELQALEFKAMSQILDQLSEQVALFSGRAASSERTVSFEMQHFKLKIREPSYGDSDLGWQTWPAGILLASYISKMKPSSGRDALELGCGTGLVGIASALHSPMSHHHLTDYHENVLSNVDKNLELNGPPANAISQKLNWDWFEADSVAWSSDPQLEYWKPFVGMFKSIFAADVLYQLRHAYSVPRVLKAFLAPSNMTTPNPLTHSDVSRAYILIPIRATHLHDTDVFEKELVSQDLSILDMVSFAPPKSSSRLDIEQTLENPTQNVDISSLLVKDYSSLPPREAILAYKLYVCAKFS